MHEDERKGLAVVCHRFSSTRCFQDARELWLEEEAIGFRRIQGQRVDCLAAGGWAARSKVYGPHGPRDHQPPFAYGAQASGLPSERTIRYGAKGLTAFLLPQDTANYVRGGGGGP